MRVLVLGGTGFIGVQVVRQLAAAGHKVSVFHRGQTTPDLPPGVEHIYGDRQNLAAFTAAFENFSPAVVLDVTPYTEAEATAVVQTFRGLAERLVVLSSLDVYRAYGCFLGLESGAPDPRPLAEDAALRGVLYPYRRMAKDETELAYHYDKLPVERIVMSQSRPSGTVLRLPKVYGAGDKQHHLFDYLKRMDDGRPAILLSTRQARWRWSRGYVENVAAAIVLAVTSDRAANRVFNVGEADALTEAEWVECIAGAAQWDGKVVTLPDDLLPPHLTSSYHWEHNLAANTNRVRAELGYAEHVARAEALRRTIHWGRKNPPDAVNLSRFDYAAEDAALAKLALLGC